MFEKIEFCLPKIIDIINLSKEENKENTQKIFTIDNLLDYQLKENDSKLEQYLNSLTFDEIKVIQTIMYIGRDPDDGLQPQELFDETFESSALASKDVEINQILGKVPLATYLENGLKKLKLK